MSRQCAAILAALALAGSARATDTGHWFGNASGTTVEFRDVGNGNWQEARDGKVVGRYRLAGVRPRYHTDLQDPARRTRVRLWGDRAESSGPDGAGFVRFASGGWKDRFYRIGPIQLRYHGRYAGAGNVGGEPVDAFDRAAQRHDIGYERHGRMDAATDARLVADSIAAALVPTNHMKFVARIKAAGAALLFSPKVPIDVQAKVVTVVVDLAKKAGGLAKKANEVAKDAGAAAKKVGNAATEAAKSGGKAAEKVVKKLGRKLGRKK